MSERYEKMSMPEIENILDEVREKKRCPALIIEGNKVLDCVCRQPRLAGCNIMGDEVYGCLNLPELQKTCLDWQRVGGNLELARVGYDRIKEYYKTKHEPSETKRQAKNLKFTKYDVVEDNPKKNGWKMKTGDKSINDGTIDEGIIEE